MNLALTPMARLVAAFGALLLILAQVPRLVDQDRLRWIDPLDSLVQGGGVGTSLLLAVVGFAGARMLWAARESGRLAAVVTLVTILLPLWLVQAVVVLGTWGSLEIDTKAAPEATSSLAEQWVPVMTMQWNLWVSDHILEALPELTGLTLLSLVVQLLAVLAVAVVVLPPLLQPFVIGAVSTLGAVVLMVMRGRALDFQDPFVLSLDTFARADAFLLGVAAACVVALLGSRGPGLSGSALLLLGGAVMASTFIDIEEHFWLQLPATAILAGMMLLDDGSAAGDLLHERVAATREVEILATAWVPIVAAVVPIAVVMERRTEMHWSFRVLVTLLALAALVRLLMWVPRVTSHVVGLVTQRSSATRIAVPGMSSPRTLDQPPQSRSSSGGHSGSTRSSSTKP